ncbi:MAG: AsmA-like C-terminal domain-containing protein, partial [Magnetococcales bacterium]|nr:AsmA-like C-terminal domain-containing protein [Magnetococcales bacterium]
GYTLERLAFNQDGSLQQLESGAFRWQQRPGSGPYVGQFRLRSDNLGALLRGLDRHQGMQGGKALVTLALAGSSPAGGSALPRHLSGKGEIESQNGVVHRLHLLASLLGLLSIPDLPNLLVGNRPDLTGTGFYYETMKGDFTLDNGLWHTDQWVLTGPSMKIVASGDINLVSRQLDLLVGIQPLQTIDRIINRVPLLGKLVAGSREAIVETQFQVSGPWSDPITRIKPMDSLAPGIVRDIIDLPGKLLRMSRPGSASSPREGEEGAKPTAATAEGDTPKSQMEDTTTGEKSVAMPPSADQITPPIQPSAAGAPTPLPTVSPPAVAKTADPRERPRAQPHVAETAFTAPPTPAPVVRNTSREGEGPMAKKGLTGHAKTDTQDAAATPGGGIGAIGEENKAKDRPKNRRGKGVADDRQSAGPSPVAAGPGPAPVGKPSGSGKNPTPVSGAAD